MPRYTSTRHRRRHMRQGRMTSGVGALALALAELLVARRHVRDNRGRRTVKRRRHIPPTGSPQQGFWVGSRWRSHRDY